MSPEERVFLERSRVGTLATADAEGRPHAVPICFAVLDDGARIVSAIDEKPKSTRDLRRARDVRANPRAAVLVHRYVEDWSRLGWVQVRGRARVVAPDDPDRAEAIAVLEAKYEQYADHDLDDRRLLEINVGRVLSWGDVGE